MSDLLRSFNKEHNPCSHLPQLMGWSGGGGGGGGGGDNLKLYATSLLDCMIVENFHFGFDIQKV